MFIIIYYQILMSVVPTMVDVLATVQILLVAMCVSVMLDLNYQQIITRVKVNSTSHCFN